MATVRRPAGVVSRTEVAYAAPERRAGAQDRRAVARGADRRAGPRTAARLARVRIEQDLRHLGRSVFQGNWREVTRMAGGIAGEVGSFLWAAGVLPLALWGPDLPRAAGSPATAKATRRVRAAAREEAEEASERPVVLLHGWFHNRTGFVLMARRFRAAGRRHVYALDLPTATTTIQQMARILDEKIGRIREITGAREVDVVAHSLGGLVARWWMHQEGGGSQLNHLVTLGSPNNGTALAAFVPIGSGRAINVGSEVLRELDLPPPAGVRVTAIWSDLDYAILSPDGSGAGGRGKGKQKGFRARNVRVRYVGHLSLLYSKRVFEQVERALRAAPLEGAEDDTAVEVEVR